MSENTSEDLLTAYTKNDILVRENNILKIECEKLENENKVLKSQLREIYDYCNITLKCF